MCSKELPKTSSKGSVRVDAGTVEAVVPKRNFSTVTKETPTSTSEQDTVFTTDGSLEISQP